MKINNKILGQRAEDLAVYYLQKQGFLILERNWRFHRYEIDIIAQDKDQLVIVEVKSRSTTDFGPPEDGVNFNKRRVLIESADNYCQQHKCEVRFDLISVVFYQNNYKLKHIKDAFHPHEL